MSSRLRKFGITAVSAAVGAGIVTWALDQKPLPYTVSICVLCLLFVREGCLFKESFVVIHHK